MPGGRRIAKVTFFCLEATSIGLFVVLPNVLSVILLK